MIIEGYDCSDENMDRFKDRFEKQKRHAVNKLDVSIRVGDADAGVVKLLKLINACEDYYTTSSCEGRIQVFQDVGSKKDNKTLGCWHRKVTILEVLESLKPVRGVVYFKFEPPILHVAARGIAAARKLLIAAREAGFKKSGIQAVKEERFMVELASTENIDAPVMNNGKRLVADEYVKYLAGLANVKHARTQSKIKKLETLIKVISEEVRT
jgi:tRNA wybutosine-synthesizing protein 3